MNITQLKTNGRRKEAVARISLVKGNGTVTVNKLPIDEYFPEKMYREMAIRPLTLTKSLDSVDVAVLVNGGGRRGQADAIAHGIAKALRALDESMKGELRRAGLLTRDSRVKERKKPGLRRARRSPQWAKR
jgi:small subunit ribosomal protein S9